ncbi:MAG: SIS domain-containing protein [Acidobacteriota bacterium]
MLQEIKEQPAALARILQRGQTELKNWRAILPSNPQLIILVARGSSDNAALFGRYLLELSTGIPVSLAAPSIHTLYRKRLRLQNTLVIGVSQSGEGKDINIVLESCRRSGACTLGITNERNSTMASLVDALFWTGVGRERSVAATKTYTAQLMAFYILARVLSPTTTQIPIEDIPELTAAALKLEPEIDSLVERYRFMRHCVVVARGLNYANACEFAIKLMETSYLVAKPYSSADFLHGPVAVIERDFPAFVFAPRGRTLADMGKLIKRLRELQSETLVISSEASICRLASKSIRLPKRIDELLSPIPYVIPAQLFAALLAERRGLDPDNPRSLTKITQTV